MSARSGNLAKESLSVDSVKRKLDFDEPCTRAMDTEPFRAPIWKTKKSRRLDFGETHLLVRLRYPDLLPNRIDVDLPATMWSYRKKRTDFTSNQKATLEAKFRTTKYPSRQEKNTLAVKLDINIAQVQIWFSNRRQKWRKEQKKGAVGPSGSCPVLPGASSIQTSHKLTAKRTVSFSRFPQFPTQLQVPSQPLPSTSFPATVPFAPVSRHVTESFAACSYGTRVYPQQSLHVQQAYPPFPGPLHGIRQQQPQTNYVAQQTVATSYPVHHSLPPVNPVEPDIQQAAVADSRFLADEFPFSFSIAKELPHIFGNLEDDEVLDRPLTPTFEPPNESEPLWNSLAPESDHFHGNQASLTREDFTVCESADHRHFQPVSYSSCCYGNSEMASPPLKELSYGFISKGRSFRFCRQD
ncbi:hypothetical protein ACROYT_G033751 [Oculina patagonica]